MQYKWMNKRHIRGRKCSWDQRTLREEVWSVREEFGKVRRQKGSKEIEKNEVEIALTLYIEIHNSRYIERCREVSRFKTRESAVEELFRICWKVSTAKRSQWIKKLSRIYQASRKFLDGSSRYQEAIKNAIKSSWKGSIDSLAVERCPSVVEIA